MAETICKCVCGGNASSKHHGGYWFVSCNYCQWSGSMATFESEAIAAWNAVMRPRPVVTERHAVFDHIEEYIFEMTPRGCHAGFVTTNGKPIRAWDMSSPPAESQTFQTFDEGRAWLRERLTAAGFDVAESEEGK